MKKNEKSPNVVFDPSLSPPPLTWERLLDMHREVTQRVDSQYKFSLPNLDVELDIRDYYLAGSVVYDTVSLLRHSAWANRLEEPPAAAPASIIWLKGATRELVERLVKLYPHLAHENKP